MSFVKRENEKNTDNMSVFCNMPLCSLGCPAGEGCSGKYGEREEHRNRRFFDVRANAHGGAASGIDFP